MKSLPEDSGKVRIIDLARSDIGKNAPLHVFPIEVINAPGWIGLHNGIISWISLGKLDRKALAQYWPGSVVMGKACPISTEAIVKGVMGEESLEVSPLGTPFQREVWKQLLCIPFSTTKSYGEIAASMGSANKARAVGTAVGSNPIAVLIPCHRVLPANGKTGAYRWGSHFKEMLVEWEKTRGTNAPMHSIPEGKQKLEEMLLKAQRFEDIAKLAGDIAHDLNNLLAPIGMATQLLKRKLTDELLDRYVDIIETSTCRARSVVQEILSFSRETEEGEFATITVSPILKEIEKIVHETFPKTIKTSFDYSPAEPTIKINPIQFHRAILNILVNARDATGEKGEIHLTEKVQHLDMEVAVGGRRLVPGKFVCISISDTGCGIPEDIREKIFDPFFTTKPKDQGTGLGLASVYGIIARAGGFIDIESKVGAGSTFHLYLPQAPE